VSARLLERLSLHARTRPDAIAVGEAGDAPRRALSWRALHDTAAQLAQRLRDAGPAPVIVVSAANRLELYIALLAGLAADGAVLPVSPELPPAQLRDAATRAAATVAIGGAAALGALGDLVKTRIATDAIELQPRGVQGDLAGAGTRGALLLLSSGTTDVPKLIRRDAAALDAMGRSCQAAIGVRDDDVMLLAIPLHHSYGIDQGLLTAVFGGCRVVLHDGFDLARVRASLRDDAVTLLPAVPFLFDVLARGSLEAPSLRRAISAGGPLPLAVFEAFRRSTGLAIGQIYGSTEFGSVTWGDPDATDFAPESVGRPLPGVAIRILDPGDPRLDRPLAAGAEGQVAVAAPSMLSAYVGEATPPTRDGFFVTGDLGRLDAAGRLTLTGRSALLIDVAGRKVNPLEVEAALARHPRVAEVVVVPIPYSRTVGRMKAVVVPAGAGEVRADELRAFLRERLAAWKIPRRFEFLAALPRSPSGKVLRRELEGAELKP
jgi:acyl-CoA synthetase (AMP-forming)/AMP-acid ligase II